MCYFITIGLPHDRADLLAENVPRGLHAAPVSNIHLEHQLGQGLRTFFVMSGGYCSCDLFREPPGETDDERQVRERSKQDRLRRKYEKMGWSAAKIERALTQSSKVHHKASFVGLRDDVQRFLGDLATRAGNLAVVVHWYDEDLHDARFACKVGSVVSAETALEGKLQLTPDKIVWIKAM